MKVLVRFAIRISLVIPATCMVAQPAHVSVKYRYLLPAAAVGSCDADQLEGNSSDDDILARSLIEEEEKSQEVETKDKGRNYLTL